MLDSFEGSARRRKETAFVEMFIRDGIFQAYFKPLELLDLPTAVLTVNDRLAFFEQQAYPCLFDVTQVKQTTKEARDFMAKEGNQLVLASAMIVNSPMLKMIANFYIMVSKPQNPTQLFTDRRQALEWLEQFKSKSFS